MDSNLSIPLPLGRVTKSCDRCHRQKLKCDPFRPCTLCTRSNVNCVTSPTKNAAGTKRRRTEATETGSHPATKALNSPLAESLRPAELDHLPLQPVINSAASSSSMNDQQFGTTTSSIEFARSVFGHEGGGNLTRTSLIPGHAACDASKYQPWTLQLMRLPPEDVMQALINKYFQAYHWYISLFNEHTFRQNANLLLRTTHWQRKDMGQVVAVLAVALLGLQGGITDDSWSGTRLLHTSGIDAARLSRELSSEIRLHLLDVVDDCSLEAVQVCLLSATFHVYHESPNLGWILSSMALSVGYALGLQSSRATPDDPNLQQIRSRCWNHIQVADTFALNLYGRPALIDIGLFNVHELSELDETISDPSILNHPIYGRGSCPNTVTFHVLKAKLYRIMRHALDRFRVLQHSHQDSTREVETTIEAVSDIQTLLTQLRSNFPPLFEWENWKHSDPWKHAENSTTSGEGPTPWRKLLLQATMIRILYNGAVILAHRPLLVHKISSLRQSKPSTHILDSLRSSLDIAVNAALSISQTQIERLQGQFCISFFFMHLFTAGVILCMAPASQPLSLMSQQAKSGIVRIIKSSREASSKNRIAQHTEKLLSELLKITLQREMDNALRMEPGTVSDGPTTREMGPNSRDTFQHAQMILPSFPTVGQARQMQDPILANVSHATRTYTPEQLQPQSSVDTEYPGDTLFDIAAGQLNTPSFPNNLWPFRDYAEMNLNVGGFDAMMFNLLPGESSNLPHSEYPFEQ